MDKIELNFLKAVFLSFQTNIYVTESFQNDENPVENEPGPGIDTHWQEKFGMGCLKPIPNFFTRRRQKLKVRFFESKNF